MANKQTKKPLRASLLKQLSQAQTANRRKTAWNRVPMKVITKMSISKKIKFHPTSRLRIEQPVQNEQHSKKRNEVTKSTHELIIIINQL